ncbi:MAG TPA: protein-disulfide reductase DsbD N-terminal domain-containing protein, partial [Thermoanaerobaculia bacterium]|nr:protein-disulfide reductase DsbD N-terminal domain-containing protein [Thermoanaerobaculia bacterium]
MRRGPAAAAGLAAFLLGLGLAAPAAGQAAPDPSSLVKVAARIERGGAGPTALILDATLAAGWHVNSHRPSEDYLIATSVKLDPAAGISFGEPRYPEGKSKKFAFAEKPLSVYEGSFRIEVPIAATGAAVPALSGSIEYQACSDKQCLAPASAAFKVQAPTSDSAGLSGGAVPLSQAPEVGGSAPTRAAGASQDFGQLLERRGFPFVLLLLFAGGLALNLTPCVYPVIPLTIGFFGGQAKGESRRVFGLAAVYVLGMATMYS